MWNWYGDYNHTGTAADIFTYDDDDDDSLARMLMGMMFFLMVYLHNGVFFANENIGDDM